MKVFILMLSIFSVGTCVYTLTLTHKVNEGLLLKRCKIIKQYFTDNPNTPQSELVTEVLKDCEELSK